MRKLDFSEKFLYYDDLFLTYGYGTSFNNILKLLSENDIKNFDICKELLQDIIELPIYGDRGEILEWLRIEEHNHDLFFFIPCCYPFKSVNILLTEEVFLDFLVNFVIDFFKVNTSYKELLIEKFPEYIGLIEFANHF